MIARLHRRQHTAEAALGNALERPVSFTRELSHRIVASWDRLDLRSEFAEREGWSEAQWAAHLSQAQPRSAAGDSPRFLHFGIRLHRMDRPLAPAQWSEIAHRLARTAGLAAPADGEPCRWIALQFHHGRLDVIASLVREDGTLTRTPRRLAEELARQTRILESEFDLTPARPPAAREEQVIADPLVAAEATPAQIAEQIRALTDEVNGSLAQARRLAEQAGHQLATRPEVYARRGAHQLEWAAGRLYGLLHDLEGTAETLANPPALLRNALVRSTRRPARAARRSR
ncbi:hypothetical protein [Streptomyces sp. NPDC086023]|uniref:hypothetical protein n=1 Tax=Streptomyces sp. NPDC086023 TaxID=3365746 RepID=UPI0037D3D072